MKLADPEHYKAIEKKIFKTYLAQLHTMKFVDPIERQFPDEKHIVFIGPTPGVTSELIERHAPNPDPHGLG
jgi:hypothetical protein